MKIKQLNEEISKILKENTESVNETKEYEDDKVKYVFTVTLIGKAEEEKSNAFYKENIKRALENELDKYDLKFEVENA